VELNLLETGSDCWTVLHYDLFCMHYYVPFRFGINFVTCQYRRVPWDITLRSLALSPALLLCLHRIQANMFLLLYKRRKDHLNLWLHYPEIFSDLNPLVSCDCVDVLSISVVLVLHASRNNTVLLRQYVLIESFF
jgi:hypothetical protein